MSAPYETFDIDLREGKAREDAFVHVVLRSRVEHKRDKKAARTGNCAIEIAQVNRNGEHVHSGVMATTAQYFAIEYFPECWLVLPTEYVKGLAQIAMDEDLKQWIGDGQNHLNALVPIDWFVQSKKLHQTVNAESINDSSHAAPLACESYPVPRGRADAPEG